MNYFPFHIGDYAVHTRHLSLMEDLAYRRLIDLYYTRESALPSDPAQVARLIGMRDQVAEVGAVLTEFFTLTPIGWTHTRCDAEITKANEAAERARANGKKGGRPVNNPEITQPVKSGNPEITKSQAPITQDQDQDPRPKKEQPPSVVVGRSAPDPTRYQVPDCPYERLLDVYHEALPMLARVVVFNAPRRASLRSRWVEVCSAERYETDDGVQWFRDFLWGVRKSKFLTGNSSPSPGRQPFKADLEWLMKPTNFAKVIEGRYHGETA